MSHAGVGINITSDTSLLLGPNGGLATDPGVVDFDGRPGPSTSGPPQVDMEQSEPPTNNRGGPNQPFSSRIGVAPPNLPDGWRHLEALDLNEEFKINISTLEDVPTAIRKDFERIQQAVIVNLANAYANTEEGDHPLRVRGWKLFCLLSRMLLHRLRRGGSQGTRELRERISKFDSGQWDELLNAARERVRQSARSFTEDPPESVFRRVQHLVARSELSHAARLLRSNGVAPGTPETLTQLTDPTLRPPAQLRPLTPEVLNYIPDQKVHLDRDRFVRNLRSTRRGLSAGLGGTRNEHLKIALGDEFTSQQLCNIAERYAQADIPQSVNAALRMCKMTAVKKSGSKVRGLNAGDSFRRVVARTLAQQFAEEFRTATAPFNYGMSVHSGMDAIIHILRSITDEHPDKVITKIDGVGAFDHILRTSMLEKLRRLPTAHRVLPFVLLSYASPSVYLWTDSEGNVHEIPQAEDGEQGDALMPALFCLGLDEALTQARSQLLPNELLVAYLDDIYLVTTKPRARQAYDTVTRCIREMAGVEANLGKTECWGKGGGEPPPGVNELAPSATSDNVPRTPIWKGDLPAHLNGIEVLGSPIGTEAYVAEAARERLRQEKKLLDKLRAPLTNQTAWLLLSFCAAPRANHILRTLPPSLARIYGEAHDEAVRSTLGEIMGLSNHLIDDPQFRQRAQLPLRLGGLGLKSSTRTAPCAYWASWADSLTVMRERNPDFENHFLNRMISFASSPHTGSPHDALFTLHDAAHLLASVPAIRMPSCTDLLRGRQAPQEDQEGEWEPGKWRKGWQFVMSNEVEKEAQKELLNSLILSQKATFRSASGKYAGR